MSRNVCITGGTGMVGSALRKFLFQRGYALTVLSRSKQTLDHATVFTWDVREQQLEEGALGSSDYIVHLAGANLGSKRWTDQRKKEIRDSRINSTRLLHDRLSKADKKPESLIAASAIGIYGYNTGGILVDEERVKPGDDFVATVAREWEEEVLKIGDLGIRIVILRAGLVLSMEDGALPRLVAPVKFGIGAPVGSGDQYISWIHIDDLCRLYLFAMENKGISGMFNAVSPQPETNTDFTREIAETLNKPFFMPNIPSFVLRILFGEMASTVLGGNRVSSKKIEGMGFEFQYPDLGHDLEDLLKNK
jgi:uncharacterized protein (TIGR01777 family)